MRKLILAVSAGVLALWLFIMGTMLYKSTSGPSPAAGDGEPYALQTIIPSVPVPSEAVTDVPATEEPIPTRKIVASEAPSNIPEPSESAAEETDPGTPAASELISNDEPSLTLLYQKPELPNGCEVTSLAMLLAWAGYPVDKVELSDNYLPKQEFSKSDGVRYGPDPNQAYAGDPASPNGWYCFEGPILEAANAYLSDQNTTQQAAPLSGAATTREELENYMNDGIPLAVWVTLYYAAPQPPPSSFSWYLPDGSHYMPYSNLHCVVLAGWDGDNYRIANPLAGWETVSPDTFWSSFSAMGCRAVAVLPN